jgi:Ser/Thr protein kinase RdoA (MazF antagonist)
VNPAQAFAPWQLDAEPAPTLVRRSTNEIWLAQREGSPVYLRLTPTSHRGADQVAAEVAFMAGLHQAGVRVVRPLVSRAGRLVEQSEAGSITCFAAAPGRHARKPDDMRAPVLQSWAALMADLHRFARDHRTPERPLWHDDRVYRVAQQASDPCIGPAHELLARLGAWMHQLPTGADGFGLTHADLHLGNLSVDPAAGDAVTAFDFDDSCRHWFVHDLAVGVTSIRKAGWEAPGRFDAAAAEATFVRAYAAQQVLAPVWQARLEAFVAYRIALSACWASRSQELGELDAELADWFERSRPWWLGQLELRRAEIDRALAA